MSESTSTQTISNPTWTVQLPADWTSTDDPDTGLYFESGDGSRGMYIATWTASPGQALPPREMAESFLAADLNKLTHMEECAWRVLEQRLDCDGQHCIAILDSYDQVAECRMTTKILAREGKTVRAVFHDDACGDLAASRAFFAPLLASLTFTAP
ncbi:hypothetical protein KY495_01730 [Massilia sp. PAMC28688]|uniref:hypothetical protein n=1 Tax=Massilia sp. PAMC28688 TaxID=2861283 RepID=UPI001C62C39D|nr:hypothetical protein [Massilia sp. PAMC28688]QYF93987.1 hypothetical protein KY495_01730 [Massilia sp. PAMC28688]